MMNYIGQIIQNHVTPEYTVLDLGCGIMQATYDLQAKTILGADIWPKYLDNIKHLHPTILLNMNETDRFMDKSFDVVLCLDVIEHLEETLALKIIDECKRIARKMVIIYTPKIFNDNKESIHNSWGLGECPYQEHKCVLGFNDFRNKGYHTESLMGDDIIAFYEVE